MPSTTISSLRRLAALVAASTLLACSAPGPTDDAARQSGQSAAGATQAGSGMTGGMAPGASASDGMDMNRMCAIHREIRNAPPEQRHAVMERYFQQMSPEMRQRHMDMMGQQCP
ncbi:hypothetical protein [Massilia sp. ST3]|uniref:hypothetical protein n=1 Tax=Massilia sp. ST3 TaxID=2824903 RepID=UPI001B842DCB|nr:hypothetical protein [Massilia sp. ST3]MBQ5948479.1 hypothetical protein [Massilia sp. ST3]